MDGIDSNQIESNQNQNQNHNHNQNQNQNDSLGKRTPLDRQDNTILSLDSNGGASSTHGLHGVFHLEQVSVGTEYCDCSVVAHVIGILLLVLFVDVDYVFRR